MVDLGMTNTRTKYFFDVWFLCREFEFQGHSLVDAIRATFERRQTPIPDGLPMALTDAFAQDEVKTKQWKAFLSRSQRTETALALPEVVATIAIFLRPAMQAARDGGLSAMSWSPTSRWTQ